MHPISVLLRTITLIAHPMGSHFLSSCPRYSATSWVGTVYEHALLRIQIDTPRRQYHIIRLFKECLIWLYLFCCRPSYSNVLIVCRQILLLILKILIRNSVDFKLIWSIHKILAFCLLMLLLSLSLIVSWVGSEISTSYCNSLTSYASYVLNTILSCIISTEVKIKASDNILLQLYKVLVRTYSFPVDMY